MDEIETEHHAIGVSGHSDGRVVLYVADLFSYPGSQIIAAFLTKEQAAMLGEKLTRLSKHDTI